VVLALQFLWGGCSRNAGNSGKNPPAISENSLKTGPAVGIASRSREPLAKAIPFEVSANKVFLRVRINDAGPFWFQLDSGSIYNVLDRGKAEGLGIRFQGRSRARTAGESVVEITHASGISLQLGGIALKGLDVAVLPLNSSLASAEGHEIDGLLGYDFIRRYCIEIDYLDRILNIYAPDTCNAIAIGEAVPLAIQNGALYASGTVVLGSNEEIPGTFLVDTGFRNALVLNEPFVRSNNLLNRAGPTISSRMGFSLGGETRGMIGRLFGFRIGSIFLKNPVVAFSQMKSGVLANESFSGVIGGDVLRRFTVVLDCPDRQLWLKSQKNTGELFEFDMSGVILNAEGDTLKTFRVVQVLDHSPASEADVRPNDFVEAVDGFPSSSLTLERISELFKDGAGKTHHLLLQRGHQELKTTIKLRRLV
jgi:hypothetical protein